MVSGLTGEGKGRDIIGGFTPKLFIYKPFR